LKIVPNLFQTLARGPLARVRRMSGRLLYLEKDPKTTQEKPFARIARGPLATEIRF
jgi:hypothetical protein